MPSNSFGELFRVTSFGESHGPAVGVVIDGCPAGITVDEDAIHRDLARRKPGQSEITTSRKEDEDFEILSGVFEGITTGTPIAVIVRNKDARSSDYDHLEKTFRPSHADFTYSAKFGHRDHRGGGRSSARETVARVIAGAFAKMILEKLKVSINACVSSIGNVDAAIDHINSKEVESSIVRCPNHLAEEQMLQAIEAAKAEGDTLGGVITCSINGVPTGWGEPVFDKLEALLAHAMMSLPATKGFEIGEGFQSARMRGSEHNDVFKAEGDKIKTKTNHSGGVQGGISNGMEIRFRLAFKPVSTLMKDQRSVDKEGNEVTIEGKGRHDPCVVPRAVPIVEAMAAIVLTDLYLRSGKDRVE